MSASPIDSPGAEGTPHNTLLPALAGAVLAAQQVGAKITRDALFLSHFDSSALPPVTAAAAVLSIGSALVTGRFMARVGAARCMRWLFALQALAFVLEYAASTRAPAQVAVVLYLHVTSLSAVAASAFWSTLNERFDPYTAKHVISRIGAGATAGGVLGGLLTHALGRAYSLPALLLGFGALNAVLAAGAFLFRSPPVPRAPQDASSAAPAMQGAPYLRTLALLVVLLAAVDTFVDYVFKSDASRTLGRGDALLSFFSAFYALSGVATFLAQSLLGRRVLLRLGVGGAVALLPTSVVIAAIAALLAPGLGPVTALRALFSVIENSFYRSGYELLFTPLPARARFAAKTLLDVAAARLGAIAGSGAASALVLLAPATTTNLLLLASLCLCAGALILCMPLRARYVVQLARSLRSDSPSQPPTPLDSITLHTLLRTAEVTGRAELLRQIELMRDAAPTLPGGERAADASPPVSSPPPLSQLERVAAFESGERERIEHALRPPLPPALVAFALPCLANDALARAARRALRPHAASCTGQLLDALLDPGSPPALRRRLPELLQALEGERVQRGLLAALADPSMSVRERSARALAAITKRSPRALTDAEIFSAVSRELARSPAASVAPERAGTVSATALQTTRMLKLVFALLEVCLEPEAIALCLQALLGRDPRLRGTALEYLEQVLPPALRITLVTRFTPTSEATPGRPRQALVDELRLSQSLRRPHMRRRSPDS